MLNNALGKSGFHCYYNNYNKIGDSRISQQVCLGLEIIFNNQNWREKSDLTNTKKNLNQSTWSKLFLKTILNNWSPVLVKMNLILKTLSFPSIDKVVKNSEDRLQYLHKTREGRRNGFSVLV